MSYMDGLNLICCEKCLRKEDCPMLKAWVEKTGRPSDIHTFFCSEYKADATCEVCEYSGKCDDDPQKADYCPLNRISGTNTVKEEV